MQLRELEEYLIRALTRLDRAERQIRHLEHRMSAVDDIVAALNDATNKLAAELAALRNEVAGDDSAIAAKFQPILDQLVNLGADPANPVPPVDGGGDGTVPPVDGTPAS